MNSAGGFLGSNTGRTRWAIWSIQYSGVPSAGMRKSYFSGGTNIRLVSSNRPLRMRSTHTMKAAPPSVKASRVCGVGQMKSATAKPPTLTTRSHSQPMRRACSTRSASEKPRSLLTFLRTSSALKCTALSRGARPAASVVFPAPGNPMMRIFRSNVVSFTRVSSLGSIEYRRAAFHGGRAELAVASRLGAAAAEPARAGRELRGRHCLLHDRLGLALRDELGRELAHLHRRRVVGHLVRGRSGEQRLRFRRPRPR